MHAEEAVHQGKPVFEVEGHTSLYCIPNFDLVRGLVPDIMHGLFLGVNQQLTNFGKKTRTSLYSKMSSKILFCSKRSVRQMISLEL